MSRSRGWWAMEGYFSDHHDGPWKLTFDSHLPGWPQLFRTRRECRAWIEEHHGYIRTREDLRRPPHNWRMPRAVKVDVVKVAPIS